MIRQPSVAGMFYPSEPSRLRAQVAGYIHGARLAPDPSVTGLVCPHAGYVYSGAVAGMAYAAAPDGIETVMIVAPCHRFQVSSISVFGGEGFLTPLGVAEVNMEITGRLLSGGRSWIPGAHASEHAEEVQIPFIQTRWPGARIVSIVMGTVDPAVSRALAEELLQASGDEKVLMVASSDLSHYHTLQDARVMDGLLMDDFRRRDPESLAAHVIEGYSEACGAGPILTLLCWASLQGEYEASILGYNTSASVSGDTSAVVGYMAGIVRQVAADG